jgi:hypothetical protein
VNTVRCLLSGSRCRTLRHTVILLACAILVLLLPATLFASSKWPGYPFPFVSSVSPEAVSPGVGDFTLTVYGANFNSSSIVNWNRQARQTTFISARELQTLILASDVMQPTAGYITVTNTTPGGLLSTSASPSALVEVHVPTAAVSVGLPNTYSESYFPLIVGDLTGSGKLDLAHSDFSSGYEQMSTMLGAGNGTFVSGAVATDEYFGQGDAEFGDVNGDGKLDLVFTEGDYHSGTTSYIQANLGNGDGTFSHGKPFGNFPIAPSQFLLADFNRDGTLDIAVASGSDHYHVPIYSGNGDGTFRAFSAVQVPYYPLAMVAGDFNGDGILDLVIESDYEFTIHLGNGDGTFQPGQMLAPNNWRNLCVFGRPLLTADFNGDGVPDLAFCNDTSIGIMIGRGDGTFEPTVFYSVGTQGDFTFAAGDFNSDGRTDLIISHENPGNALFILLGNGDGTFGSKTMVSLPEDYVSELPIITGDFNSDGLLDFILEPPISTIAVFTQQ